MTKTDVSGLTQLGAASALPASPDQAVLEKVPAGHAGTLYCVRFTAPEFTSLCPMTGQPDFAHIVIDYVPRDWLVESKSLKLYLAQLSATTARSTRIARWTSARSWWPCWIRSGCGSGPIGFRAVASR